MSEHATTCPMCAPECAAPECAGMGGCLRQEHVDHRKLMRLEPGAINAWLRRQRDSSEFDSWNQAALDLIEVLLARVELLTPTDADYDDSINE